MSDKFAAMEAHYSVPDPNKPFTVSGLLNIPKPAVSCICNYLRDKDDTGNVNDFSRMMKQF